MSRSPATCIIARRIADDAASVWRNLLMAVFSISDADWDLGSVLVAYLAM